MDLNIFGDQTEPGVPRQMVHYFKLVVTTDQHHDWASYDYVFECLHPDWAEGQWCHKEAFADLGNEFLEAYANNEPANVQPGEILSWYTGYGEDAEIHWRYLTPIEVIELATGRIA